MQLLLSSNKLAGWSMVVASSQCTPSFRPSFHPSFACCLYFISGNVSSFHPSLHHGGQCLSNSWHLFMFLLYPPHCWMLLSAVHHHPSIYVSSRVVSMRLYAHSGTDPLFPSVKRTKGIKDWDLSQLARTQCSSGTIAKARPRRGG